MPGFSEKTDVRSKFKKWLAIPKSKRAQTGIPTQQEFAQQYGVHPSTLSQWKNDPAFMSDVDRVRRSHLDRELSDIYESMIERAKEGDVRSIKMAFKMAGRWEDDPRDEKAQEEDPSDMSDIELVDTFAGLIADGSSISKNQLMVLMLQSLDSDIPQELLDQIGSSEDQSEETDETDISEDAEESEKSDSPEEEAQISEETEEVDVGFDLADTLHDEPDDEELLAEDVEQETQPDPEEEEEDDDAPTTDDLSMPEGW